MFNSKSRVRYVMALALVMLFSFATTAMDFNTGVTVSLCDSFGKTWSAKAGGCSPALPLAFCLTGARDTLNLNGCGGGPQTMFGTIVGVRFLFDAYTVESTGCSSTFWEGVGTGQPKGNINGSVFNPAGLFGGFTITLGACPAGASVATRDPIGR